MQLRQAAARDQYQNQSRRQISLGAMVAGGPVLEEPAEGREGANRDIEGGRVRGRVGGNKGGGVGG